MFNINQSAVSLCVCVWLFMRYRKHYESNWSQYKSSQCNQIVDENPPKCFPCAAWFKELREEKEM